MDDSLINRRVTSKFLEKWGFDIAEASNALEAFEMLSDKSFSLILMDIEMPEIDGFEASQFIRNLNHLYYRNIPIIAFSAHKEEDMKARVESFGVNDYIEKPFSPELLRNKINNLIEPGS